MISDFCAGGLVFYQSELLIIKRFSGAWLFPKGHIDPGEDAVTAALREVKEESGLTARILAPLGDTSYRFKENGQEHAKTVTWYLMETDHNEVQLEQGFFSDYKWITASETGTLTFMHDRELAGRAFQFQMRWKEREQ